jgi:hypothetical protein
LQPSEVRRALGFANLNMLAATTLHSAFKRLDTARFAAALQTWAVQALGPEVERWNNERQHGMECVVLMRGG